MTCEEKRKFKKTSICCIFFFLHVREKRGEAVRVWPICVKMIGDDWCRGSGAERKIERYSSSSSKEQQHQQQRFLYSYAKKSASRQLLLKKHATDARRRKFSNDDDVERARE